MRRSSGVRALGFAGALAILLTACSTTGAPTGGGAATGPTATDAGKSFVFASTQFTPVTEQEAMRKKILGSWTGASVEFITDAEPVIIDRITAEAKVGGTGQIGIIGLENGQFGSLVAANYLNDLSAAVTRNADKKINGDMLTLGKFGGTQQLYVPFFQQTYFLAFNKKALQYLPTGADVNALTYDQLIAWSKNIFDKTGKRMFGWPMGSTGLIHRMLQGYWYPSFTGGLVTTFKSAEAVSMWGKIKELWQYSNPQSTTYNNMEEALQSEEVWIAMDHGVRLIKALRAKPDDFVAVPAPAGPKGRYYMSVVVGLGIPKTTPNLVGANALIDHLLKPETQITILREVGFFPVIEAQLPADLDKGLKLEADAVTKQSTAKDGKVVPLPVGLGSKGGEFNTAMLNTFQRIAVKGDNIETVLNEQAAIVNKIMTDANAKCWGPDGTSSGPCQVK
jgi:multiple sugar transport system substrate-binding protein